ncbi:MAG TPA: hypothetical protein VGF97_08825 [Rhizomicrobium sp.]|jgi:hypothetical protein
MGFNLDEIAVRAAFSQPDPDGTFSGAFGAYLREMSARRPAVIFAFPPKAAGTFLRSAAIEATDGQLARISHAQGGRDAQPYLPLFIAYYAGLFGDKTMVTHGHMQALPANCHFLEAFDLRPIIMVRPIADMLTSYWDMLEHDDLALAEGLNCSIPPAFRALSREHKAQYLIDIVAPWYAGYYATWFAYAEHDPRRVCMLVYDDFRHAPAEALATALSHARVPRSREVCAAAVQAVWAERVQWRFNRGIGGRGKDYFNGSQIAQIGQMLSYYAIRGARLESLIG